MKTQCWQGITKIGKLKYLRCCQTQDKSVYKDNDIMKVSISLSNTGTTVVVDAYIILVIDNKLYFFPDLTTKFFCYESIELPSGLSIPPVEIFSVNISSLPVRKSGTM